MKRSDLLAHGFMARSKEEVALTTDDQHSLKAAIPEWNISAEGDSEKLVRVYRFKDFVSALDFANHVGRLAEEVDHHPIMTLQWGQVRLEWWTHEISGLHKNDFVMAARSDLAYEEMDI